MARTPKLLTRPYWVVYLGILGSWGGFGLSWVAGWIVGLFAVVLLVAAPVTFLGVIIILPSRMRPRPMCYGVYATVNLTLFTLGTASLVVLGVQTGPDPTWLSTFYLEGSQDLVKDALVSYASVLFYGASGVLAAREAWHTRWRARVQRGEEHG